MDRVRGGVLGAAKIARDWVCPAIQRSARGTVAAVASRDPARAEALAAPHRAAVHGSYEDLLADPAVDAVYVPLPNAAHVAWTRRALEAGKHVLCEKPIALRAEEVDGLIAARDAAGRFAAEAFMVVHHPQWRRVRDLLAEGAIGELRHIQAAFAFNNPDPGNIRNMADQGGGALRDIGVYPVVTTRFALGQEPRIEAARIDWDRGIDATARVWAAFGAVGVDFYVSMRMANRQEVTFHGAEGVLTVRTPFNAKLYGDDVLEIRRGDTQVLERFPLVDQYQAQMDAAHAAILDGQAFACPLEFSRANQQVIDAIYAAA